jgi:energy-coupling factor transporter ATP-binding protein EcfA2
MMAIRKTNTNNVVHDGFFALIAGESGAGKTYLARTLPNDDTLIISKESGLLSLKGTNIEVLEIETFDDFAELVLAIKNGDIKKSNVYIDSLTDILDTQVAALKEKYPNKKDSFKMWDEYTSAAIWAIKTLRDSKGYNIIFTCLTAQEKDGTELVDQFDFSGSKLKYKIKSFFDLAFHLKTFDGEDGKFRGLVTSNEESKLAKDRSGCLLPIEKPDLTYIIDKIKE